jgi:hypothetical protein
VSVSQSIPEITPQFVIDLVTRLEQLARVNSGLSWGYEIIIFHLDHILDKIMWKIAEAEKWPVDEWDEWDGIVPESSPWHEATKLVSRICEEQRQLRIAKRPRGRKARQ